MVHRMRAIFALAVIGVCLLAASSASAQAIYARNVKKITASTPLNETYDIVLADASTNSITITLPSVVGIVGRHYQIKRLDNITTNTVKIVASSGQTVDGQPSYTLAKQYQEVRVVSDGTRWNLLDALSGGQYALNPYADHVSQTASIAATPVTTPTIAGVYRVTWYAAVTSAGTAGTMTVTIAWNDGTRAQGVTSTALPLAALGAPASGTVVVYSAASQAIRYSTAVTGATGSPQYMLHVRAEKL